MFLSFMRRVTLRHHAIRIIGNATHEHSRLDVVAAGSRPRPARQAVALHLPEARATRRLPRRPLDFDPEAAASSPGLGDSGDLRQISARKHPHPGKGGRQQTAEVAVRSGGKAGAEAHPKAASVDWSGLLREFSLFSPASPKALPRMLRSDHPLPVPQLLVCPWSPGWSMKGQRP
jgi:hypothetical protein